MLYVKFYYHTLITIIFGLWSDVRSPPYFVSDKLQAGHVVRSTSSRCEPAVEDSVWVMVVEIYNKVDT